MRGGSVTDVDHFAVGTAFCSIDVARTTPKCEWFATKPPKHSGENLTDHINTYMLISEITIKDWKASKKVCNSNTPDEQLGASTLSSCKSQGLRKRTTKRKYKIGGVTKGISGKKVRGGKYGGTLPVHGKKNRENARKGKAES